jgi:hypothetical protein
MREGHKDGVSASGEMQVQKRKSTRKKFKIEMERFAWRWKMLKFELPTSVE